MCEHGATDQLNIEDLLDAAERALEGIDKLPLGGALPDTALVRCVQRLEAVARMAQGRKLALIGELEQREAHRGQAADSTADLLARLLHLAPGEARAQADLATGLALVPATAEALLDGRIGISQAAVTVKKAEEVRSRDDAGELLAKIDATAAEAGQRLDRNRLAREIDTTVARAGVDVLAERERTAHARRRLDITTRDGMTIVHAELDPVGGAQVRAALDALSRKDGESDRRSFPQRQADALTQMAALARTSIAEGTALSSRVLLITTPEARACDATARRLSRGPALARGSGTLSSPGAAASPPDTHVRPRAPQHQTPAGVTVARAGRGRWPCDAATARAGVRGHTRIRPRGRSAPEIRLCAAATPTAAGPAISTCTNTAGKSPATRQAATAPDHPTSSHRTLKTP